MRLTELFIYRNFEAVQAPGVRQACWSPGSAALRASLTFNRANGAGLAEHPCPSDLKWASSAIAPGMALPPASLQSRPFDPYPACLFGALMGTSRPPAHRLPSRFEQNRAKKSENLKGMQWTG